MSLYKNIEINKILNSIIEMDSSVYTLADKKQKVEYYNIKILYNHHVVECNNCYENIFDTIVIGDDYIATCCNCGEKNYNN